MQFPSGYYAVYLETSNEKNKLKYYPYYENIDENFNYTFEIVQDTEENICANIKLLFEDAVKKRLMSERPVGCLLSGGLDSSVTTAIVHANIPAGHLNTYCIGMKGSVDL